MSISTTVTNFGGFGSQNPPGATPGGRWPPRGCPRLSRSSPEGPWRSPGEGQGPPLAPPGSPEVAEERPKGRPKPPQSGQKWPEEAKFEAKPPARAIRKLISVENQIRNRFSSDFRLIFHRNRGRNQVAIRSRLAKKVSSKQQAANMATSRLTR